MAVVTIIQNGKIIIDIKVDNNVTLLVNKVSFLKLIEYATITEAGGAANIIIIIVKPILLIVQAPVSFPIAVTIKVITKPITGATKTFIIVPYHILKLFKLSFNVPFVKLIPIANHANGVQIACNVTKIFLIGGKVLSNRNGENYLPLPSTFWSGTTAIPGINCVTQKVNPIIVANKIGFNKIFLELVLNIFRP